MTFSVEDKGKKEKLKDIDSGVALHAEFDS